MIVFKDKKSTRSWPYNDGNTRFKIWVRAYMNGDGLGKRSM